MRPAGMALGRLFFCRSRISRSLLSPRNRHQGKGFWVLRDLSCLSSPLKPCPAAGRGLSPSSGSTGETPPQRSPCPICSRCPVTHFSPSPARQRWVPARPDALNQQEKKKNPTSGFKARARDGFLYRGLCSEPRPRHAAGSPVLLPRGGHGPVCKDAAKYRTGSFKGKKWKGARAASPEPLAKCLPSKGCPRAPR